MNATASTSAMKKMGWLLRREFWENKGGVYWAPIFTGAVFLGCMIMGILVGQMSVNRAHIKLANLNLNELVGKITPEILEHIYAGTELTLYGIAGLLAIVLFFVLFFYCIGALYDDRRDRSVLFWKSLPLSDRATVASKAITALLVAPAITWIAAIATGVGFLVLLSLYVGVHGVNPFPLLWAKVAPAKVAFTLLATLPVQALWALPTVGWLLLCSAWARTKPLLWAVAAPIAAGVLVNWFDLLRAIAMPETWFWKNIVFRLLLSIFPGSWLFDSSMIRGDFDGPRFLLRLVDVSTSYGLLATPQLWIGAIAGVAMMLAAVHFRRKRDEG